MKMGKWMLCGLAVTAMLAGCKGFWDAPTTTGTGGSGAASGNFYVLNQKTPQIAGFAFAKGSTAPAALTGSPYSLAASPLAMALSPNGSFLYVSTIAGIYVYTVGSTGTLTVANGGQIISQDQAYTMAVDGSGVWLVEAVPGMGTVNAIAISATTGLATSQTEQTVALPALTLQQLAVSPANSANPYVFVAMGIGGTAVIPFTTGNANPFGKVSTINTATSAGAANTIAVDPSDRLLYVGETAALTATQTGGLRAFNIGATALTEVTGSPYNSGGTGPSAILPTASYVYVANRAVSGTTTGNISGFAITATGTVYSLTAVNTIASGISTVGLAEDSTNTYLLAVNSGGTPDLSTYTFDATTAGKLDASATAATGTDPAGAIAIVAP